MIHIDDETGQAAPYTETARQAIEAALTSEGVTNYEVGLTFVSEQDMQSLNRQYRGINAPTDILSFPQYEDALHSPFTIHHSPLPLGDLLLCLSLAKDQAERYGHGITREVAFLAAHGTLHLLGYDHATPEDEARMTDKQEAVLQSIGIRRD